MRRLSLQEILKDPGVLDRMFDANYTRGGRRIVRTEEMGHDRAQRNLGKKERLKEVRRAAKLATETAAATAEQGQPINDGRASAQKPKPNPKRVTTVSDARPR